MTQTRKIPSGDSILGSLVSRCSMQTSVVPDPGEKMHPAQLLLREDNSSLHLASLAAGCETTIGCGRYSYFNAVPFSCNCGFVSIVTLGPMSLL